MFEGKHLPANGLSLARLPCGAWGWGGRWAEAYPTGFVDEADVVGLKTHPTVFDVAGVSGKKSLPANGLTQTHLTPVFGDGAHGASHNLCVHNFVDFLPESGYPISSRSY